MVYLGIADVPFFITTIYFTCNALPVSFNKFGIHNAYKYFLFYKNQTCTCGRFFIFNIKPSIRHMGCFYTRNQVQAWFFRWQPRLIIIAFTVRRHNGHVAFNKGIQQNTCWKMDVKWIYFAMLHYGIADKFNEPFDVLDMFI